MQAKALCKWMGWMSSPVGLWTNIPSSSTTFLQFHPSEANSTVFLAAFANNSSEEDHNLSRTLLVYSSRDGIGITHTDLSRDTLRLFPRRPYPRDDDRFLLSEKWFLSVSRVKEEKLDIHEGCEVLPDELDETDSEEEWTRLGSEFVGEVAAGRWHRS